jgi:DNA repair exonuclease SbcCD ATPase subunit
MGICILYKRRKTRIAELEEKLNKATTAKKTSEIEDKLTSALARLEAIEKRYTVPLEKVRAKESVEEEPQEEEGTQCPECGCELIDIGNGVLECSGCGQLWEDE